ncbi:MAG: ATP-dependent zinc metalloprotease FtsH [Phycisphaerales bacterium]|nr:ATP-dependent zinc metalloprotease FtsH [Phycisphaerales bacterium]
MAGNEVQKPEKPTPPRPGGEQAGPKMSRGVTSWLIIVGLAIMLVVLLNQGEQRRKITISEFLLHVENGDVEKVAIRERLIQGTLKPGQGEKPGADGAFEVMIPKEMVTYDFIDTLHKKLPDAEIESKQESLWVAALVALLPWLLIFAFIWFVVIRQFRNAGGGPGMFGSFGRSRHRITSKEHTAVRFTDVAGIAEAKEEVSEIVEFLKNPKKFQRLGGRIPRGVLLVGSPGCGKTLLAKAIAGEADVPFFSISGSDFVEMFVGVGASRVRDLFKQAKENSPCIIFLDEIDAVGRRRGANFGGGGHDEREQTLNAILVEMDGFDTSDQVIVIAATNRVDVLDPALIRPGRFDRQVNVPNPDLQGRYEILKVHARKIKMGPTVDMRRVARGTPMFSGADLAAIINEAALIATMANKEFVEQDDLEEARDKVRWGRAHKSRSIDERDQLIVAYHEAGHALIQALEKHADPIHKVSIIPRGPMGGATFSLPERDRLVYSSAYLKATLKVTLGGRLAEEIYCGEASSGAATDIQQATEIVRSMVMRWGMSEKIGFMFCDDEAGPFEMGSRHFSEETAARIDSEVRRLLDEAYAETKAIMLKYKDKGEVIAQALIQYETLSGDEVNALIRGESLDRPTVTDLLDDSMPTDVGKARPVKADATPDLNLGGGGAVPQPG